MNQNLSIFVDAEALSQAAADLFFAQAQTAVADHGRFLAALAGGGTPQKLFSLLSQEPYREQFPWQQTVLFWGDERLVSPTDPESSYGLTKQLLLTHVPIPSSQIFRVLGEADPDTAVRDYAAKLAAVAGTAPWPQFDLVLLGMGRDGHTASLFPGPITEQERTEPVIIVTADYDARPACRLTLTPLVFNEARHVLFLVTGAAKAATLSAVLEGEAAPESLPAQRIQPSQGTIHWLVDKAAAADLKQTY